VASLGESPLASGVPCRDKCCLPTSAVCCRICFQRHCWEACARRRCMCNGKFMRGGYLLRQPNMSSLPCLCPTLPVLVLVDRAAPAALGLLGAANPLAPGILGGLPGRLPSLGLSSPRRRTSARPASTFCSRTCLPRARRYVGTPPFWGSREAKVLCAADGLALSTEATEYGQCNNELSLVGGVQAPRCEGTTPPEHVLVLSL